MSQASLFINIIILGFFFGFVFDILRVFRKIVKHKTIFIHIEDLLYWMFALTVSFIFLYYNNNGEIRFYCIVGAFIGIILYFNSLSKLFMKASMQIYAFLCKVVHFIFGIILAPLALLVGFISKPLNIFKNLFIKLMRSQKKKAIKTYGRIKSKSKSKPKTNFKTRRKVRLWNKRLAKDNADDIKTKKKVNIIKKKKSNTTDV